MLIHQNSGTTVVVEEQTYIYFGGTNYLGLAHRTELLDAAQEAFYNFGFSAGASRLTSGESELLLHLERKLASFAHSEAALVLPAGFMSNLAVVDALDDLVDIWMIEKNAHASIKTALATSRKETFILDDNEQGCRAQLNRTGNLRIALFAEPISAMKGQICKLQGLSSDLRSSDYLILDESHSFGVLGAGGRGAAELVELSAGVGFVRTGTLSKAIGTQGGFVLGTGELVARIIEKSATYRAATPLSPVLVAASIRALQLLQESPGSTIDKLRQKITLVNAALLKHGIEKTSQVPIFFLPDNRSLTKLQKDLKDSGLYVPQVGSYFASANELGLRWTIQANHSAEQLELLISVLSRNL